MALELAFYSATIRLKSGFRLINYPRIVNKSPNLDDLRVFCVVARKASFSAAAEELSVSPAYVSKRVGVLEADLGGTRLLHRSTRRVGVTEAGERVYEWANKILDDVDHLMEDVSTTRHLARVEQLRLRAAGGGAGACAAHGEIPATRRALRSVRPARRCGRKCGCAWIF
ncbi:Positive regulator of Tartrate dehydrogenase/decarboxylase/D-malic enzyme [Candidatus Burkholderia brachyanthoides]|nr:Positive regulator of Tartrate dehydrogenase/decarboxylase/D-malic enzyme [Candidatus Burkholderia brachyanthoides]